MRIIEGKVMTLIFSLSYPSQIAGENGGIGIHNVRGKNSTC